MGDYQARFCERLRVKLPLPTRLPIVGLHSAYPVTASRTFTEIDYQNLSILSVRTFLHCEDLDCAGAFSKCALPGSGQAQRVAHLIKAKVRFDHSPELGFASKVKFFRFWKS